MEVPWLMWGEKGDHLEKKQRQQQKVAGTISMAFQTIIIYVKHAETCHICRHMWFMLLEKL